MSTSCIIVLKEGCDIVLLEKTHDGFEQDVRMILNKAVASEGLDCENISNWLIKNTDVRFSLFSHKYPNLMVIFNIDNSQFKCISISPFGLTRISQFAEKYANEIIGE